jgi:PAS domain-containing protein
LQWNIDDEKRKEDEMRARDNVWGSVLKIFPGWVWASRPDGKLEFASDGAREYFGEAFGTIMADLLAVIHPDNRERRSSGTMATTIGTLYERCHSGTNAEAS